MRKILIILILITIQSMGESFQNIEGTLTQEERFEMLFGKTMLTLRTLVKSRPLRVARKTRIVNVDMLDIVEEKQKLVSINRMTYPRITRASRKEPSRQRRHSLYITLNY